MAVTGHSCPTMNGHDQETPATANIDRAQPKMILHVILCLARSKLAVAGVSWPRPGFIGRAMSLCRAWSSLGTIIRARPVTSGHEQETPCTANIERARPRGMSRIIFGRSRSILYVAGVSRWWTALLAVPVQSCRTMTRNGTMTGHGQEPPATTKNHRPRPISTEQDPK